MTAFGLAAPQVGVTRRVIVVDAAAIVAVLDTLDGPVTLLLEIARSYPFQFRRDLWI